MKPALLSGETSPPSRVITASSITNMKSNPPPPYKRTPPASMSRSRTAPGDVSALADQMLRASLARSTPPTNGSSDPISSDPRTLTRHAAYPSSRAPVRPRPREREPEQQRAVPPGSPARRESTSREPTREDLRLRLLDLKRETTEAGAACPPRPTDGLFRRACSTDLLFLIDTTGSMWEYIQAAKDQVRSIMADIKTTFLEEAEVRIAVVGYKDHDDKPNIQFLDFTPSVDDVHAFLDTLQATGGDDAPEDVLGGIRQAVNAAWHNQTRTAVHIADAPAHGRIFHDLSDRQDNYPEPGTEPHRLTYKPWLAKMITMNINYVFLRINRNTDRMALVFLKEYAAVSSECRLHTENKYFAEASQEAATASSRGGAAGSVLFEELPLGTSYSTLRHLVVKSVTGSASRTAVRLSSSSTSSHPARRSAFGSPLVTYLDSIGEDVSSSSSSLVDVPIEDVPPQWDTPGWLDESLAMEGFSPDVIVHGDDTLSGMMEDDDNIRLGIMELSLRRRSTPFAQGAMRTAAYARLAASTSKYVVKANKRGGKRLAHLAEDMRCQALCKAFALEFNALNPGGQPIDFIVTACLRGRDRDRPADADAERSTDSGRDLLSLELYIPGDYVKYNSNSSYVLDSDDAFNRTAQAFSHFTYERSWGRFLVCDLQGVGHVLTDPAVHTLDPDRFRLADANLNAEGFKFFFATHRCNDVCARLGLESTAAGLAAGQRFRERWPTMRSTACCSNKLCGRIVLVQGARRSPEFPGCLWCDECWPQLESSKVSRLCVAPGPDHEFMASRFFYESQGRVIAHRCSEHRDPETAARTAVVGRGFWNRLKDASKKSSVSGRAW